MAPKKGSSSQASSSFDNKRFISYEAEKKFTKFEEDEKALVRERVLKPDSRDAKFCNLFGLKSGEHSPIFQLKQLYH